MNHALVYTFLHSLWQGALLSILTGFIMTFTRNVSAARRYNCLVGLLAFFVLMVAGTFIYEFNQTAVSVSRPIVHDNPVLSEGISHPFAFPITIGAYLNKYANVIVGLWLLIVCLRCGQLVSALHEVYELRRKDLNSLGNYWEERVRELSLQINIKRPVRIMESGRINAPLVTGHLKPLILIPISMFTHLSADQAEAILLHELAHVRRADYLVNLLQNLLEIVFFFNPAVLWLSALIKAERENCCDDIAVARSGKANYLNALVACQEYNQPPATFAMAITGGNGGLKKRVSRIISNKNFTLNGREKSLLLVFMIAIAIFAASYSSGEKLSTPGFPRQKQVQETIVDGQTQHMISDLVKDGIISSPSGLSFKISKDEFVVNYKKQPPEILQKYWYNYIGDQHDSDLDWYYHFDKSKAH